MTKLDYKKEYKELYMPTGKPTFIDVPSIAYVMVEGKGNPNTSEEYKTAIEILYAISYTIKMSKMRAYQPKGYFDYVVPPLEGLWWGEGEYFDGTRIIDKNKFCWKSIIRLPEFVTPDYFEQVKKEVAIKKPHIDVGLAQFFVYDEGQCVQIMHKGPYDDEPESIAKMNQYMKDHNLVCDINDCRYHHEIYLSDPRRTKPENLKVVIRHPVRKK